MPQVRLSAPTFSIRLDFIIAAADHLSNETVRRKILALLREPSAAPCQVDRCTLAHACRLPVTSNKTDGDAWSVTEHHDKRARKADNVLPADGLRRAFTLHRMTISSPICDRWTVEVDAVTQDHVPYVSAQSQVAFAMRQLDSINDNAHNGIHAIYTDRECAFDVFVGSGNRDKRFTYKTLKNTLKVFIMFEALFDNISQDAARIRHGLFDSLAAARTVHLTQDHMTLINICKRLPTTYSAVNLIPVIHTSGRKAMRFLQHSATLDVQEIVAWISTCVGIVAWLESSAYGAAFSYGANRWYDLNHSLPQFIQDIGADPRAAEQYTRMLRGGTANIYERLKYEQAVTRAENNPARAVLISAARARYLSANRSTVSKVIHEKILNGHYGWLPEGSSLSYAGFPLVSTIDGTMFAAPFVHAAPAQDVSSVQTHILAIKKIPKWLYREQLLSSMADEGLPVPYRLTYLYSNGFPIGTAFADFVDPADANVVMNSLNASLIHGVRLEAEYKRILPRIERNRMYREERDRRVWSGESSSTDALVASATDSNTTGQATATSEETAATSTVEETAVDSVLDEEEDIHSCLSWQSSAQEPTVDGRDF